MGGIALGGSALGWGSGSQAISGIKSNVRSIHTNVRRGLNTSNMGPAPSTLRKQNLIKLYSSSMEARIALKLLSLEHKIKKANYSTSSSDIADSSNFNEGRRREKLKLINDMQKLKNQIKRNFTHLGGHSLSLNNSEDTLSLINNNENRFEDNKNKSSQNINLFLFTNIINILENEPIVNETQLKIERFLYAQFDEFLSNKGRSLVLGVDTKMFTTPNIHIYMYVRGEVNLIITVLMIQELWKY